MFLGLLLFCAVPLAAHVAVFGPKTYSVAAGAPQTATETIALTGPCDGAADAVYTLVVRNDGVSSASIRVNSTEVIAERDFNQQVTTIERNVTLTASSTLSATIKGGTRAGSLTISISRHMDVREAVFGEKTYTTTGKSDTFRDSFSVADPAGSFSIVIRPGATAVSSATIRLNGAEVTSQQAVTLKASNELVVDTKSDGAGASVRVTVVRHVFDAAGPQIALSGLAEGDLVGVNPLPVSGVVSDPSGVASLRLNGAAVPVTASGAFAAEVPLVEGPNALVFEASDCEGNSSRRTVNVIFDIGPPRVTVTSPAYTNNTTFPVAGTATASNGLTSVTANGTPMAISGSSWSGTLSMPGDDGPRNIQIIAIDQAGRQTDVPFVVTIDRVAPVIVAAPDPPPNAHGWLRGAAVVKFECTDSSPVACEPVHVVDQPGTHTVTGTATDAAGNSAAASIVVKVDVGAPELTIDPVESALTVPTVSTPTLVLGGSIADELSGNDAVFCNDVAGTIGGNRFTCSVTLQPGSNQIAVRALDRAGQERLRFTTVTLDVAPPSIYFGVPAEAGTVVPDAEIEVVVYATDESEVAGATINGVTALRSGGKFTRRLQLAEGTNQIAVTATDRVGNARTVATTIQRITPVRIAITDPEDLSTVSQPAITVRGTVTPANAVVTVNDVPASVSGGLFTAVNVPLAQGRTVVTATATSASGVATASVNIYRDSIPPRVVVYSPADGAVVRQTPIAVSGMVDDIVVGTINSEQLSVTVNGVAAVVKNRAFLALNVPLTPGVNTLNIVAVDQGGNSVPVTTKVTLDTSAARKLTIVSGNAQTAAIGATLPQPLVVRVVDAAGNGVAGETVRFSVVQNNGSLTVGAATDRFAEVVTNSNGNASVTWTLGTRAGAGNQRVTASAPNAGSVELTATGNTGQPNLIVIDSGNGQFGLADQKLPRPMLAIVVDAGSNRLANVPVTFRVAAGGGNIDGQATVVVNTDSDGRAWVTPTLGPEPGNDNNFVEATVAGVSRPAVFVASGREGGSPAETTVTGIVVDNTNLPVPGVTLRIDDTTLSAQANAQGRFTIANAPVGYVKLIVDGSTAQRQGTWPTLEFVMYTLPGVDNTLGMPIYLLPIDVQRGIQVTETTGGMLTFPELPGFSLTVEKGSALFPNGSRAGTVSATLVHPDKMPMPPAFGQQPRFIVTIQPVGVHFDPPAKVTFPNLDNLAPGEVTELYSFDHDLGQFVSIGPGSVSSDGSMIVSDAGVGILKGGWHGAGNPNPTGNSSAVNVQISVPSRGTVGQVVEVTASGTPANGGQYFNWQVVDDPADAADSTGAAQFLTQPSCSGSPTCVAQLKILSGGRVTVQVSFQTSNVATITSGRRIETQAVQQTTSQQKKITVPAVEIDTVLFQMAHTVCEDRSGSALPLSPTQWIRQSIPSPQGTLGDPVVYERSLPNDQRKIKAQLRFKINGTQTQNITGITIRGEGGGFTFTSTDFLTIPAGASTTPAINVESTQFLPATTRYVERFEIQWSYALPGSTEFVNAGKSLNPFHVLLGKPKNVVYKTLLKLGESNGQSEEGSVLTTVWNRFAGPANITTWDERKLFYYKPGVQEWTCAFSSAQALLTKVDGCGQCTGFARVLQTALGIHGIDSTIMSAVPKVSGSFIVKNIAFDSTPFFPNDPAGYLYRLLIPPNAPSDVPPLGETWGDITSVEGIKGQNTDPPFDKLFNVHYFLMPVVNGNPVTPWLDPSYGVMYANNLAFESAIAALSNTTNSFYDEQNGQWYAVMKVKPFQLDGANLQFNIAPTAYVNND